MSTGRALLTPCAVHALPVPFTVSDEKARAELGFSPRPIAASLREALAWHHAQVGARRRVGPGHGRRLPGPLHCVGVDRLLRLLGQRRGRACRPWLGQNACAVFKLDSETALLQSFRPKDRKALEPPPGVTFPLFVPDYLAWPHPAGGRVYLVFAVPKGAPTGIAFDTNGGAGEGVPQMCDWCHGYATGTGVRLLTATVTGKKRVGVHLCADLGCQRKLEDEANRSGRSVRPAMQALLARMGRFASEGLNIDLLGKNR